MSYLDPYEFFGILIGVGSLIGILLWSVKDNEYETTLENRRAYSALFDMVYGVCKVCTLNGNIHKRQCVYYVAEIPDVFEDGVKVVYVMPSKESEATIALIDRVEFIVEDGDELTIAAVSIKKALCDGHVVIGKYDDRNGWQFNDIGSPQLVRDLVLQYCAQRGIIHPNLLALTP